MSRLMNATAASDETTLTKAWSLFYCSHSCVAVIPCVAFDWKPQDRSCELLFFTKMGISQLEQQQGVFSYVAEWLL